MRKIIIIALTIFLFACSRDGKYKIKDVEFRENNFQNLSKIKLK